MRFDERKNRHFLFALVSTHGEERGRLAALLEPWGQGVEGGGLILRDPRCAGMRIEVE